MSLPFLYHALPMRWVGPIQFAEPFNEALQIPLATYETTLWASVARGAKVSRACGGVHVHVGRQQMTRSIVLEAADAMAACRFQALLLSQQDTWQGSVASSSRFAKLEQVHVETVGPLIYLRFSFFTADAAGHNMVTKASEAILKQILAEHSALRYVSLSANYCADKKVSAVNSLLGRGQRAVAEVQISSAICEQLLHTSPQAIVDLHLKKNLIGSILAGSLRSANAHFANMLLAFYLATGQDGANIVEGSQGLSHAQLNDQGDLCFSCTLPNLIVGTVGHGKNSHASFPSVGSLRNPAVEPDLSTASLTLAQDNLAKLGCTDLEVGQGAARLAAVAAAVVLCGELSLLAALTRPEELMRAHTLFERAQRK